jgi:hypothetical protein
MNRYGLLLALLLCSPSVHAATVLFDDAESGIATVNGWQAYWSNNGDLRFEYSADMAHSGARSLKFSNWSGGDYGVGRNVSSMINRTLEFWMYDDTTPNGAQFGIVTSDANYNFFVNLQGANYIVETGQGQVTTNVPRSTGWHHFLIHVTPHAEIALYIDETLALVSLTDWIETSDVFAGAYAFDAATMYVDDIQIYDGAPTCWKKSRIKKDSEELKIRGSV